VILTLLVLVLSACGQATTPAAPPLAPPVSREPAAQEPAVEPAAAPEEAVEAEAAEPAEEPEAVEAEAAEPAEEPAEAAEAEEPAAGGSINIESYFPEGEGREETLTSCAGCHSFAPLIIAQKSPDAWRLTMREHRSQYMESLSDEDAAVITAYLIANFNPDKPVPELPPELLEGFTNY
jgi:hypothetical protein